jgi:hypothetical protein
VRSPKIESCESNMEKPNVYSESPMSLTVILKMLAICPFLKGVEADAQVEFERMKMTYREDRVRIPLRSELKSKHEQIRELRDRAMTNVSNLSSPDLCHRHNILTCPGGNSKTDRCSKTSEPLFSPKQTSHPNNSTHRFPCSGSPS